ncbi:hypothetical protein RYX36_015238, partial [Vicia faba]
IGIGRKPANSAQEPMQLLLNGVNFDIIFIDFDLFIFVTDMRALEMDKKQNSGHVIKL